MSVCPKNSCAGGYGNCLDVKITNTCNAKCEFCIERGGLCPEAEDVQKLIDATIAAKDFPTVLVLGGEPLMYPHLGEYLQGIRPHKEHVYLTTNGSLLNNEQADMLSYLLDGINISVHHYSEFLNDLVYQTAHVDFAQLREAIKVLHGGLESFGTRNPSIPVRFNTNLVKGYLDNYKDVYTMIRWAAFMGADEIRFAELQNCEELWVDSREIFPDLPADPFTCGCEQTIDVERLLGQKIPIKVIVKMTCGRVNKLKCPVAEIPTRTGKTNVLYTDAKVRPGWMKSDAFAPTAAKRPLEAPIHTAPYYNESFGCHGPVMGCH